MFKSKNQPEGLKASKGCDGCSKHLCRYHGAAFTPEYVERESNAPFGCNDRQEFGSVGCLVIVDLEAE